MITGQLRNSGKSSRVAVIAIGTICIVLCGVGVLVAMFGRGFAELKVSLTNQSTSESNVMIEVETSGVVKNRILQIESGETITEKFVLKPNSKNVIIRLRKVPERNYFMTDSFPVESISPSGRNYTVE